MNMNGIIQQFDENLYIGWIPEFKGLIVQGKSIDEIKIELLISLKVKTDFDNLQHYQDLGFTIV